MSYRPADPALQADYAVVMAEAEVTPVPELRAAANDLVLRLRSRLIDLATWKADGGPEYRNVEAQCRLLTAMAGADAHPFLIAEFGPSSRPARPNRRWNRVL